MKKSGSGVFRKKTNFAAVSNSALKDKRLSLKAKGLYALIQAYITMPDKPLMKSQLIEKCKEGEKAFDTAWKELKNCGYLKIYRSPTGEDDQFQYEYELLDEADLSKPAFLSLNKHGEVVLPRALTGPDKDKNPHTPKMGGMRIDSPSLENELDQSNENQSENKGQLAYRQNGGYANSNDNSYGMEVSHPPHFAPYANGIYCATQPVPNRGNINNTHDSKTHDNKIIKSVSLSADERITDGQTDIIRKRLKKQIDYDYFEENRPDDLAGVDVLIDCMTKMLLSPTTRIGGFIQNREALCPYIEKADAETIQGFLEHMKGKPMRNVRNVSAYWQSALIDYIRGQELTLLTV